MFSLLCALTTLGLLAIETDKNNLSSLLLFSGVLSISKIVYKLLVSPCSSSCSCSGSGSGSTAINIRVGVSVHGLR